MDDSLVVKLLAPIPDDRTLGALRPNRTPIWDLIERHNAAVNPEHTLGHQHTMRDLKNALLAMTPELRNEVMSEFASVVAVSGSVWNYPESDVAANRFRTQFFTMIAGSGLMALFMTLGGMMVLAVLSDRVDTPTFLNAWAKSSMEILKVILGI